jgi:hypothetical protein
MPDDEQRDIDGQPLPDPAWIERIWPTLSSLQPPPKERWHKLVFRLLWASERQQRGIRNPNLHADLDPANYMLDAVLEYLQPEHNIIDIRPLARLGVAFEEDIARGKHSTMLEPIATPPNAPPKSAEAALIWGHAALAVTLLIKAGRSRQEAARLTAEAMNSGTGKTLVKAKEILKIRDHINDKHSPAPKVTIEMYNQPLVGFGDSPREQGERLLKQLRGSARRLSQ